MVVFFFGLGERRMALIESLISEVGQWKVVLSKGCAVGAGVRVSGATMYSDSSHSDR